MIRLDNAIDKVIFNMTVKAMLDPENEYFYLPNLTLAKLEELCDNDDDKTEMFWLCYKHAKAQLYKQNRIEELEILEEIGGLRTCELEELFYYQEQCTCPECGCTTYVLGCSCPNCDYVE